MTINGGVGEWPQLDPPYVSAALQNGGHSFYMLKATSQQPRRGQLVSARVIVWLDAEGSKKRTMGIRVPVRGAQMQRRQKTGILGPHRVAAARVVLVL
jgi:hypothetical protein